VAVDGEFDPIADQVRERRQKLGWTEAELAARATDIGGGLVTPDMVTRIEAGDREIPANILVAIALALDVRMGIGRSH